MWHFLGIVGQGIEVNGESSGTADGKWNGNYRGGSFVIWGPWVRIKGFQLEQFRVWAYRLQVWGFGLGFWR